MGIRPSVAVYALLATSMARVEVAVEFVHEALDNGEEGKSARMQHQYIAHTVTETGRKNRPSINL